MRKFCPFLSINSDKTEDCLSNCALYADNNECALKNLGNVKPEMLNEDDDNDFFPNDFDK